MRTLSFEPDDRRYERIYAVLVTGTPNRDRRAAKLHGETLDRFEAIGQEKSAVDAQTGEPRPYKPDEIRFYVTVAGGSVVLEEEAYEQVKERCVAAIPTMHPALSREFERAIEWLEGLPKQDATAAV